MKQVLENVICALDDVLSIDRHRLLHAYRRLQRRHKKRQDIGAELALLVEKVQSSAQRVNIRRQAIPAIDYPPLPIADKRRQIAEAIEKHPVVVIAGETGSGKTTQLPKICLELGRGARGMIGHTQPRRLAARAVASRIADELGVALGESVGYQVRFTDRVSADTHIKLMTDGVLLSEVQRDRFLNRYDTLIIDEAHERSLNIDFLLGYLKQLLPKRPDLKVIITSATIDVEKFSEHFQQAPVIAVSGRTYPVELWYRPIADTETTDHYDGIVAAIDEIQQYEQKSGHREGDILVFCSGESDIREAARQLHRATIPDLEVLPLYAKLSVQQQNRIFQRHRRRRIILSTNIAETSITVPGIRYVIDTGYARISRYSIRHKIQRLPIEPISQASANQRKGRCGRLSAGICIRLYSETDFLSRPAFTEAEILRTNLAAVILQMLRLGLGDISSFPFVDKPDRRLIGDGLQLLQELQAVDCPQPQQRRCRTDGDGAMKPDHIATRHSCPRRSPPIPSLTAVGRQLAKLPLDPRLGRMLLAAGKHGCVREILIIVSAMEIPDPRQYPTDKKQMADGQHRQYWHPQSDFIAYINLWDNYQQQRQGLSKNQLKQWCQQSFLSVLAMREWCDLHRQLAVASQSLGLKVNTEPASYEQLHRALLTGLLGQVGLLSDEHGEYVGARQRRFRLFPGSSQARPRGNSRSRKKHRWIVAGQLLETRQLYAHQVAKIEPEWLLASADHLVKRQCYQPHYHAQSGRVMAFAKISLYGLVIADKNRLPYDNIDPRQARDIFIRAALVEGHYARHPRIAKMLAKLRRQQRQDSHFFLRQQQLIDDIQALEAKSRRRDILVDDQLIDDFYQQRIPDTVNSISTFECWREQVEKSEPQQLFIAREYLMQHDANRVSEAQFPKHMTLAGTALPLVYHFEPGHPDDGVSLQVPLAMLPTLPSHRLQWLIPGLLREKLIAIVKGLPRQWRRHFVPVPTYVDQVLAQLRQQPSSSSPSCPALDRPLLATISEQLYRLTGTQVPTDIWEAIEIDDYYRLNIQLLDDAGECIDRGRDLTLLRQRHRRQLQQQLQTASHAIERAAVSHWDFGELPQTYRLNRDGATITAYPALVDKGDSVNLLLHDDPIEARYQSLQGVVRLALLSQRDSVKYLRKQLFKGRELALGAVAMGNRQQVMDDILLAAMQRACFEQAPLPVNQRQFNQALEQGRGQFVETAQTIAQLLFTTLDKVIVIHRKIDQIHRPLAIADIRQQLQHLLYPGCLYETPYHWLSQLPRYMQAICLRLEKVAGRVAKDRCSIEEIDVHWQRYLARRQELGKARCLQDKVLVEYRWSIEELRISLFAQTVKTLKPVSSQRLHKYWGWYQSSIEDAKKALPTTANNNVASAKINCHSNKAIKNG